MKTVLVIEDVNEIRENTSEILELAGFNVITANNGKEGLQFARRNNPDIILCDIMMPELNGYDVLKNLKKDAATANIPFIYVTASTEKSEVNMAMEMGANGYVQKPFDTDELIVTIKKFL